VKAVPADDLRARQRRRVIRNIRRSIVNALLRLATRTGGKPGNAIRVSARGLERTLKRAERAVAPRRPEAPVIAGGWDPAAAEHEHATLLSAVVHRLVPVDQPLVLMTQAPRSGGTLLMRLFDGHPACHAIPHELSTLLPTSLPLPREADRAWKVLQNPMLEAWFVGGLRAGKGQLSGDSTRYRFLLPPLLQRRVFDHVLGEREPGSDRDVLDAYLTSYFNAWLDYRPGPAPRWVTGFEPSGILQPDRLRCFRELYPDGRLVSVVRDPAGWAVSAARRNARYADRRVAIATWREAVETALRLHGERPGEVAIVPFEALVGDTERTMKAVAEFLAIEFSNDLLAPTFNGRATKANSSFPVEAAGVIEGPLSRSGQLPVEDRAEIERELGELHARALGAALVRP
jgi:sulfotransferase family protein